MGLQRNIAISRISICFQPFCTVWALHLAAGIFLRVGHGKGAPDAIGGSVKRQADNLVLAGLDLPDAKKLYNFLSSGECAIKFYFIEPDSITSVNKLCNKSLKPIIGTMKLHQLQTDEALSLTYQNLSCFCRRPTVCKCYNQRKSKFPPLENTSVNEVTESEFFSIMPCNKSATMSNFTLDGIF
jgi:hypothetical protein